MSIFRDQNLNDAYRHESDANVRERILLIRRVRIEDKDVADVAKNELHRSRAWAYKWLEFLRPDANQKVAFKVFPLLM